MQIKKLMQTLDSKHGRIIKPELKRKKITIGKKKL